MSDDTVIPLRPRSQVTRAIRSFRSVRPEHRWHEQMPLRIDPNVNVLRLIRALSEQGLVFRHDERTNAVVLMPETIARIENSQNDD